MKESKKILLVDDDETQLLTAENILKNEYEIITAQSGKEALEFLCGGLVPNLILLDIFMPNMDGWEVFNRIKAISFLQNVPIIFVTAVRRTDEQKRGYEMGAADYITKPYNKAELTEKIKATIEKHTNEKK
jgi:putative two-component system response regulator